MKWFFNNQEVYRLVPGAPRKLQRMIFNQDKIKIDIESSKVSQTVVFKYSVDLIHELKSALISFLKGIRLD